MGNPAEFLSPALLEVGTVLVEVDLGQLLVSRLKRVEIVRVKLKDTHVTYERNLFTSNVDTLVNNLSKDAEKEDKPPPAPKAEEGDEEEGHCSCCRKRKKSEPGREIN